MRRVALGQYYRAESFMHRLDPRVKIVLTALYMASAFFATPPWGVLVSSLLLALAVGASNVPVGVIARSSGPLAFFVVLTVAANVALVQTGDVYVRLGGLLVTSDGLSAALLLGWRVLALMLAGELLALTTSPVGLTDGLERLLAPLGRLGISANEPAMMFSIAIRFVPTLTGELHRIMTAQASRGAALDEGRPVERARVFASMVVPLFASALRHAEELAEAMDARCYTGGSGRTHYHVLKTGRADLAAVAVFATYVAVLVAMRFAYLLG